MTTYTATINNTQNDPSLGLNGLGNVVTSYIITTTGTAMMSVTVDNGQLEGTGSVSLSIHGTEDDSDGHVFSWSDPIVGSDDVAGGASVGSTVTFLVEDDSSQTQALFDGTVISSGTVSGTLEIGDLNFLDTQEESLNIPVSFTIPGTPTPTATLQFNQQPVISPDPSDANVRSPSAMFANGTISINFVIGNSGTATAPASTAQIYYSTSATLNTATATLLASASIPSLAPNNAYNFTEDEDLNSALPVGSGYIFVVDGNLTSQATPLTIDPAAELFTTNPDNVVFGDLDQNKAYAFGVLGANPYNGLGGNDTVTLPSQALYNTVYDGKALGWTNLVTSLFHTDSLAGQTPTVMGSDGSYYVEAGAGNDTVTIAGNGASTIIAGSGADTVSITGNGNNFVTAGTGTLNLTYDGDGNNTLQYLGTAGTVHGAITTTQNPQGFVDDPFDGGSFTATFGLDADNNFTGSLSGDGAVLVEFGHLVMSDSGSGFTGVTGIYEAVLEMVTPGVLGSGPIDFLLPTESSTATLQIDGTAMPTNIIQGFIPGTDDIIDLRGVAYSTAGTTSLGENNVLTVKENGGTYTLNLDPNQDYTGITFGLETDGAGGTNITLGGMTLDPAADPPWTPEGPEPPPDDGGDGSGNDPGDESNGQTANPTPTLIGSGQAGYTITLKVGSTVIGTSAVAANGTWSITTSVLAFGLDTITATESNGSTVINFPNPLPVTIFKSTLPNDLNADGKSDALMTNTNGALVLDEVSGGQMGYTAIGGLGAEWQFEGEGAIAGDGKDQFLLWYGTNDSPNYGALVLGEDDGGVASYTRVSAIGPEWQFEGVGPLTGGSNSDVLLWYGTNDSPSYGALVVGADNNGSMSYTDIGALGPEWKFEGVGGYLNNGSTDFLIWDTGSSSPIYGAVVVGQDVGGTAQYTLVGGLDPTVWQFKGSGDLLNDGKESFLIWDGNSSNPGFGALVIGEVSGGALHYTQIGSLGPEWQFLGTGDYDGASPAEFLMRNSNTGSLVLGTIANGTASYAAVGAVSPSQWNFHTTNVATLT